VWDAEGLAAAELGNECGFGTAAQEGIGRCEVDKVGIMRHYIEDVVALAFPPKGNVRLRWNLRLAPLTRRFGKNLNGRCPDCLASDWRLIDAALDRYMSTQTICRRTMLTHSLSSIA
jgi:hypothetical protein